MQVRFQSFFEQTQRVGRVAGMLRSQPSWLVKLAVLAALVALAAIGLLVLIPAVLLALAVFVIGAGVMLIRGVVRSIAAWFHGLFGTRDDAGRRNVRVITRP